MNTDRKLLLQAAIAATALGLLAGCGGGGAGGPPPEAAVEVVIEKPQVMAVEDLLSAVGTTAAYEQVDLQPKTSGLIESIHFTEGHQIKKGEKLIDLDSRKEAAALAQSTAEEKLARANVARAKTLLGTKAISQQEFEQLENQVAVRAAAREVDQERLAERFMVAPFDGILGPRLVSPGQYVNLGTPLGSLVDDSRIKITFHLPERHLASIRQGQEGRLTVAAYPGKVFTGTVDLIDPKVSEATRTVQVRLIAPNPDRLLRPGMFARVELLQGRRENALVVQEGALVPSLDNFSVYTVTEGRASKKPVKLGVRMPGKVEIREGLTAETSIVVRGTQKLVDGMKVVASADNVANGAPSSPKTPANP